jgi:hypothetical protein
VVYVLGLDAGQFGHHFAVGRGQAAQIHAHRLVAGGIGGKRVDVRGGIVGEGKLTRQVRLVHVGREGLVGVHDPLKGQQRRVGRFETAVGLAVKVYFFWS